MTQMSIQDIQLIKEWCKYSYESEELWLENYNKYPFQTMQTLNKLNTPFNRKITYIYTTIIFVILGLICATFTCFIGLFLYNFRRKPYVLLIIFIILIFYGLFKYKSRNHKL